VLAVGDHYKGKGGTVALKRDNAQQRHWAPQRRSIVISKPLAMLSRMVILLALPHRQWSSRPRT